MYKLMVISGPNRGTSYPLQNGEISLGRQQGNTITLHSSKISKQHCVLVVSEEEVILKDLGSSNGTFVNGVLTKLRKIKPGDRISLGEFVLEFVAPPQQKSSKAPAIAGLGSVVLPRSMPGWGNGIELKNGVKPKRDILDHPPMMGSKGIQTHQQQLPKDLLGKVLWAFEHRIMPVFYGLNLKHEWKIICLGLFAVFVVGSLFITVYPLLESSRTSIIKETERRARFMARQIAEQNAPFLAARAETKTEIGAVENAEGVRLALLIDLDNRILAPGAKMNQYLASGPEAIIAVKAGNLYRGGKENGFSAEASQDTVIAIEPVKVLSPTAGKNVVVAMAVVSIDTTLSTPDIGEMGMVYSETFILMALLGGGIFIILYRLTLKPLQVLNEDMDKALKGDLPQVTHEFKLQELNPLWEIINSAIQRIPQSDGEGGVGLGGNQRDASQIAEEFVGPLRMIANTVKMSLAVFNGDKKIVLLNSFFEEMSGIREEGSVGREITEVARDQAMGAFTDDLLSRVLVGNEGVSEDFDFSGISYKVYVSAFGAAGGLSKCYVLIAARVEG